MLSIRYNQFGWSNSSGEMHLVKQKRAGITNGEKNWMNFWRKKNTHGISEFTLWIFPLFLENPFFQSNLRTPYNLAATDFIHYIGIYSILRIFFVVHEDLKCLETSEC